jgi:hypothetical protein
MARSFGDWCLERKPRREDSGQSSAIRGQLSKAWKIFREIFQALEIVSELFPMFGKL